MSHESCSQLLLPTQSTERANSAQLINRFVSGPSYRGATVVPEGVAAQTPRLGSQRSRMCVDDYQAVIVPVAPILEQVHVKRQNKQHRGLSAAARCHLREYGTRFGLGSSTQRRPFTAGFP